MKLMLNLNLVQTDLVEGGGGGALLFLRGVVCFCGVLLVEKLCDRELESNCSSFSLSSESKGFALTFKDLKYKKYILLECFS